MFPRDLFLTSVDTVVKEIKFGREQKQLFPISGEQLYYQPCLLTIDTCTVLNKLKPYEIPLIDIYDSVEPDNDIDNIEIIINKIFGKTEENQYNNTYNENTPISNHINYRIREIPNTDQIIIAMKVNLFGDVRANYTPWMLFSINDMNFYEIWTSITKEIKITYNKYEISIRTNLDSEEKYTEIHNILSEYSWGFYKCFESIEEIIETIKEEINDPDAKTSDFQVIEV